jgi:hypothetical protein
LNCGVVDVNGGYWVELLVLMGLKLTMKIKDEGKYEITEKCFT